MASEILKNGIEEILKADFFSIQTEKNDELFEKLTVFTNLLLEWNKKFDLVNAETEDEIAARHILDSLAGASAICAELSNRKRENATIADIGSGAGFPGIPLACLLPNQKFVFVERMSKRCNFLQNCVRELGLLNVEVEENQAERLSQNRFFVATFRAFRPLEKKMLRVLLRILENGGFLAAYKARKTSIDAELSALEFLPPHKIVELSVPFLTQSTKKGEERERNLVIIEKS